MTEEYESLRKEKNIKIKYLGDETQRERLSRLEREWFGWAYKAFPGLGVGKISIEILPGIVSFVVYGDPILCFTLTSKEVADGYREFFRALWAVGKK